MRASEVAAMILAEVAVHGDGEMQDGAGWPITHLGVVRLGDDCPIFNAESEEGCTCVDSEVM